MKHSRESGVTTGRKFMWHLTVDFLLFVMTVSVVYRRVYIFTVCYGKGGKMAQWVTELAAKP